jgi:UDP-N-acetylglucosamine 2-epimerase (non-hydrolysing)
MKILSIVGARPNFMKVAPIIKAIQEHNRLLLDSPVQSAPDSPQPIEHVLVHTGQHYDKIMSDSFFADLNLPQPDVHLGVGSGSHAAQTAEIMRKFEEVLLREKPDVLIVVGDVNSTVACALVAAKISYDGSGKRPLIAHVEAGLRSFDRTMPEEINRILTDQLSDLLFVTEESAVINLAAEGIANGKVHFVGNTMIDSLLACQDKADRSIILDDLGLRVPGGGRVSPYALLTLHRPANVDNRKAFQKILDGLQELAAEYPIVFPAHPRTLKRISEQGLDSYFAPARFAQNGNRGHPDIRIIPPLGYLDFMCLMKNAALVVTDSGGIQEETTCLGIPCVTVRENTERPVTLTVGTNVLAGVSCSGILGAIRSQLESHRHGSIPENWDGSAAQRITKVLFSTMEVGVQSPQRLSTDPPVDGWPRSSYCPITTH